MHSFDRKGVHSAMICEETKHDEEMIGKVLKGLYPLVFFTLESLLTIKKWKRMLSNEVYSEKLKALVFDEAHCIAKCDPASENRPYDIFNPNGVISVML